MDKRKEIIEIDNLISFTRVIEILGGGSKTPVTAATSTTTNHIKRENIVGGGFTRFQRRLWEFASKLYLFG